MKSIESEKLALEEAMMNEGRIIIQSDRIGDPNWQGWDKTEYVYRNNKANDVGYLDYGHTTITIHYYQKTIDGFTYKYGFKFIYY